MQHQVANDILIPEIDQLLREGHEVRFTPTGVSMRPYIEGGRDSVILAPLRRKPQHGDILLAKTTTGDNTATYVLHRLIRIDSPLSTPDSPLYILQGDGNLQGEERVSPEDVIGIVIRIERPNGRRKCLCRGLVWQTLFPIRRYLLKIYRHTFLKWLYD